MRTWTSSCLAATLLLALLLGITPAASGAGPRPSTLETGDPVALAQGLIYRGAYATAIQVLEEAVAEDPQSADAYSLLGFANRKLGRYDEALVHYERALALDPQHLGALEYLGELYVETGERAAAEELLTRLDEACPAGCEERDDLAAAIAGSGG